MRNEDGRNIRKAFIPEKGYKILSDDYSQIELRIMSHFSQDETLKQNFMDGEDIHMATSREVFKSSHVWHALPCVPSWGREGCLCDALCTEDFFSGNKPQDKVN